VNARRRLLVTLLLACGTAQASEWVSIGTAQGGALEVFVDNSSIRVTGSIRRAWIKTVYAHHTVRGLDDDAQKWQSHTVSLIAFNCGEESTRTEGLNVYFDDGTAWAPPSTHLQTSWEPAPPDTMVSDEMRFVCAWGKK
jgi:hypothetical protein